MLRKISKYFGNQAVGLVLGYFIGAILLIIGFSPEWLAVILKSFFASLPISLDNLRVVIVAIAAIMMIATFYWHLRTLRARHPILLADDVSGSDVRTKDLADGISRLVTELQDARSAPVAPVQPGETGPELPIWHVPHLQNPDFTGRTEVLADLHGALQSGEPAALTQAITGLGGIGKTQIALEYAYRHRDDYAVVWWVHAEDSVRLASDYAGLATPLGLPEKDAVEQSAIVQAVRGWLDNHDGWLLVFDNAPDRESVRDYVRQGGAVIITSRAAAWGGLARPLAVEVMEADEAADFLVKRTGDKDRESAEKIAAEFDYLPLGLAQAASYIDETGNSLAGYVALFRERQAELMKMGPPSPDYPETVVTTWDLAIRELDQDSADLLSLCAFLAPDDIPLDVIVDGAKHLPDALAKCVADALARDAAIVGLRRFSLIGRTGDELTVHRLVQAVQRDRLTPADRAQGGRTHPSPARPGGPAGSAHAGQAGDLGGSGGASCCCWFSVR